MGLGLKDLHKTFWGTTKKCEIKTKLNFYFNTTFRNAWDVKGYVNLYYLKQHNTSHTLLWRPENDEKDDEE